MRSISIKTGRLVFNLCGVIILIISQVSCNLGIVPISEGEAPVEEPLGENEPINPEEEPPPEEPHPGNGEPHILHFIAHRTELQPGECTALEWQVEGGYRVEINGQSVNFADVMEVCPVETTSYHLLVDGGEGIVESEVIIQVQGQTDNQPPPAPTQPVAPQPPAPTTVPPTAKPPAAPSNCNKSSTDYITDLAITDIYPGNMPKGQFWVRITNHGPVACQNVKFKYLGCGMVATPKSGGTGVASSAKVPVTLNIKPGETQNIPTGMGLDTDLSTYMVTCHFAAESGYSDLNNSNQYYQENIP